MLRFFGCALWIHVRTSQLPRIIALFNLDTLGARRRMLVNNFMRRLKGLHNEDETKPRQRLHAKKILQSLRDVRPFPKLVDLRRDP